MKKVILSIAITAALALNAQGNSGTTTVSEDNKTGIRITNADPNNHGDIGDKAVDLSYSYTTSGALGATGYVSTALGLKTTASGTSSTAMGEDTTASGRGSTAMGEKTIASGWRSTAMGWQTTASGISSITMGYDTTASGESSAAMGYKTTASDFGSLVIGKHNNLGSSITNGGSATEYSANNTAFVIGNGTDADNKSDAFTVMFNGDATLAGTLTAGSFAGNGSQLTGIGILTPVTEDGKTGYRLSTSNAANHGNIGSKAVDLSYSYTTSGALGATGYVSTAMGEFTTASGSHSTAMGFDTTASGGGSTAMGSGTTASGDISTAMGMWTQASGQSSTAMGYITKASDFGSLVIGKHNNLGSSVTNGGSATEYSANNTAFVIGNGTDADNKSDAFTVMFNGDATLAGTLTAGSFAGNGSQLTGIGILTPVTEGEKTGYRLSTSNAANHGNIGSNAVDLSYSNGTSGTRGATGDRATAMGVGTTSGGWASTAMGNNTTASGQNSIAMGYDTTASGDSSTAMGSYTTASGGISTTMGRLTTASGWASTAMGEFTTASGSRSTAMGDFTTASDYGSLVIGRHNNFGSSVTNGGSATEYSANNTAFVIGNGTSADSKSDAFTVMFNGDATLAGTLTAGSFVGDGSQLTGIGILTPVTENQKTGYRLSTSDTNNHGNIGSNAVDLSYSDGTSGTRGATGDYATAMGENTTASGQASTAMGDETTASGSRSTAMGEFTTASGTSSTAMGDGTTASDYGSLVIGRYNNLGSSVSSNGSATSYNANNTAFVIGNGTAADNKSDAFTVMFNGDVTLAGNLAVNSDARLKANIISLGGTLSKLLKIDGKKYTKKKDKNQKLNIGVLAQDIEKVFPELVSESNGIKSVNYQGLVPVLINALKEQDSRMKDQETKLNKQQEEINELKAIVKKLL